MCLNTHVRIFGVFDRWVIRDTT